MSNLSTPTIVNSEFNSEPKNVILLTEDIKLFFSPDKNYISLCPIVPANKSDILFKLYNFEKLGINQEKIETKIKAVLGDKNIVKIKNVIKNGIKCQKIGEKLKITDDNVIRDLKTMSKNNKTNCAQDIGNTISNNIFQSSINFKYIGNRKEDVKPNNIIAFLNVGKKYSISSNPSKSEAEARLNALQKFISEFLPEREAKEINENILVSIKEAEKSKNESKKKYDNLLMENGGDRKLLKNKRKMKPEEFNRRLPYFSMLDNDDKIEDDDELYFINTANIPINEVLLGDNGIVENHLKKFKYTPLKLYEMVRDTEKSRGVDFVMENSIINDKNYCVTNEATIISQKLGVKVKEYGKSKEEAENKCALKFLTVLYRNKFKTYAELHNYFERKRGRYLDAILIEELEENTIVNNNKKKKIEEKIKENNNIIENNNEKIYKNGNIKKKKEKIQDNNYDTKKEKDDENIINIINIEDTSFEYNENDKEINTLNNNDNSNLNLINNGISEINSSNSSIDGNTSKQLLEALSCNDNKLNNYQDNTFDANNEIYDEFDNNLFYM